MMPFPVYKTIAGLLAPLMPLGALWLWFAFAADPKPYYFSYRSGFLYERLLLPPFPTFPGAKKTPEHYDLLAVQRGKFLYLATTDDFKAHTPTVPMRQFAPASTVLEELNTQVYDGSGLATVLTVIVPTMMLWFVLFLAALVMDWRRGNRALQGVQLNGRWTTPIQRFSGFFSRFNRNNVLIDVERPNDKVAPL